MSHSGLSVPVSIIIPYNKDRGWLKDAIASAASQTVKCQVITWRGDCWLSKNINDALRTTTGQWIKILAEDDLLPKTSIEDLYSGIGDFDWVCGDAEDFDWVEGGKTYKRIGCLPTFGKMFNQNCIHGGTTLYKREMLFDVGGWDESLWTGEEYDLHLKLMTSGYKLGYINKIVYKYRYHDMNKSMDLNGEGKRKRREYIRRIIEKRYGKYNNTL
jgi:GT2 family glycosyltransferase